MRKAMFAAGRSGFGHTRHQSLGNVARSLAAAALALTAIALTVGHAAAAPGDLDTSFDLDGFRLSNITRAFYGTPNASVIQADGKVVVVGETDVDGELDFALVRYDVNGHFDQSFGTAGVVTTAIGTGPDTATSVAIQSDGKLIVAGSTHNGDSYDFAVVRYDVDGSLDTDFGTGGKVTTTIGAGDDIVYSALIQSDGKIVVAGGTYGSGGNIALVRYDVDGSLDTDFGTGGKVTTTIGAGYVDARSVAIQSDGKIVVAGLTDVDGDLDFALVRYNVNGSLDTDFGTGGNVITTIGNSEDYASSAVIQSDGKIVVAGYTDDGGGAFALVRYNVDGSLDTDFGTAGKVTTAIGVLDDILYSAVIQSDGKIVVAGKTINGDDYDFTLVRYDVDGSLDTDFGTAGKVTTAVTVGTSDAATSVGILSDGRIVAAGYSDDVFTVVRYTTTGALDPTFANDGITELETTNDYAYAVTTQPDGKVVAAGSSEDADGNVGFAVMRYNPDGSPDPTFDHDGKVRTPVGTSGYAEAHAVAIQDDGKIVVAGSVLNGATTDFAVVRYKPDGSLDTTFDGDGKPITSVGTGNDVAWDVAIQSDGKIVAGGVSSSAGLNQFALVRYESHGTLDIGFSGDGKTTTGYGGYDNSLESIAIQGDGRIFAVGSTRFGANSDFMVARFNSDGSLDPSFGIGGKYITDFGSDFDGATSVAIDANGKYVVAGYTHNGSNYDFALTRYNTNSNLDMTFGSSGKVITAVGTDYDVAHGLSLQPDGKIVVAGYSSDGVSQNFAVLRYKDTGALDTSFSGDGKAINQFAPGDGVAYGVAIAPDGKIVAAGEQYLGDWVAFAVARYFVTNCGDGTVDAGESCDDGNNVSGDGCDAGCSWETSCPWVPLADSACSVGSKVQLQLKHSIDPTKNQLGWKWGGGGALAQDDFGAPDVDTTYTLCVYDTTGNTPSLATWLDVTPTLAWANKTPKGWNYNDKVGTADGVQKVQLKTGDIGKARAQVKARGVNLPIPEPISATEYLDQDPSVVVQLLGSQGLCLTSELPATSTQKNDGAQFKAKLP